MEKKGVCCLGGEKQPELLLSKLEKFIKMLNLIYYFLVIRLKKRKLLRCGREGKGKGERERKGKGEGKGGGEQN